MYVCMYSHHFQQSMDQPGMVAQSFLWSALQGKCIFTCPRLRPKIWSRETGSAVPPGVSPLIIILHTRAESDWLIVLTHGISTAFQDVHLFMSTAMGPVPSSSGRATAYRWRSLPRVHRYSASSSQGSSSNGCRLFGFNHGL